MEWATSLSRTFVFSDFELLHPNREKTRQQSKNTESIRFFIQTSRKYCNLQYAKKEKSVHEK